ncbi:alpha-amylase family glycosyl hydrolase [Gallaecimonas kandeliae]|uniref:alpha-amylase family protein n=1 Tax=Gallaecimonas kandeliae TaxID=3029055 RepID=UPI00264933AD|nr:alpha-amylase family glycosyl hydrolase [Gallaecimonas kandeliae]WKE66584.1 alpha-amylase family glycosyl hydrolase [Gallaecimonas kandeliae]
MKKLSSIALCLSLAACAQAQTQELAARQAAAPLAGKPVIYQMFTRLFGNKNENRTPWGTIEQNGVGKFADINDAALASIKALGATYIWYTGVPEHAQVTDYSAFGIAADDPDVVKGRAGSPYAVKDYYSVDPDLATDPAKRVQEFEALIKRTHAHGMKVIMDIVPNHVARRYHSTVHPERDFGLHDDRSVVYKRDNNFYYVPGKAFEVPKGDVPLDGQKHPLADGKFDENPAKWTGNGSRSPQPDVNDWFETVKINYGVKPDGSDDFPSLPAGFDKKDYQAHYAFWQGKKVPDSWVKYRDIALYWLDKGVDGFRYDVAEMVPVAFWSYMNSAIKMKNPQALLMAEVYNPKQYRDYIRLGKMDYLYDKVDTYDSLRAIIQGKEGTAVLAGIMGKYADISAHQLHFLENHDEQRIASPDFAGDPVKAEPAMVVSALMDRGATMVYFGQALGEAASQDAGFGKASRTSIFDYWSVPSVQRWMNGGAFDGGKLSAKEKRLRAFYQQLLNLSHSEPAFRGAGQPLAQADGKLFSFARWQGKDRVLVAANFAAEPRTLALELPKALLADWQLADGRYPLKDLLGSLGAELVVAKGQGSLRLALPPLGSAVLKL